MKRILRNDTPWPTRVYKTEGGYFIKSWLHKRRFETKTKIIITLISTSIALGGFFAELPPESSRPAVALFNLALSAIIAFPLFPKPLRVKINTDTKAIQITFGLFKRKRSTVDDGSAFIHTNEDTLEYRRGLNSSLLEFGLKLPDSRPGKWDNKRALTVVAAINGVLKLATQNPKEATAHDDHQQSEAFNPLD